MKQAAYRLVAVSALVAACSKSGPAPGSEPSGEAQRKAAPEGKAAPEAAAAAPASAQGAGAAAPPVQGGMRFESAEFADYVAEFPPLALPVELPLTDRAVVGIETRPLDVAVHEKYLCGTRYFECKSGADRGRFFRAYRLDISSKAIGLLYHGVGPRDEQLVLITYDPSGAIVDGLILAGDFNDREYGYDGEIEAGRTIVRNHYVWVEGKDKEYVKDRRFRLNERGGIEETVL